MRWQNMKQPVAPRFWAKVEKTETCWNWKGGTAGAGYATFWNGERTVYAYRWSYEDAGGTIPEGWTIDHLCRNRICVNPDHLEAVDLRTNILRGTAPSAVAARRDSCARGHKYTSENTYIAKDGSRRCRICHRASVLVSQKRHPEKTAARSRAYMARKKAAESAR